MISQLFHFDSPAVVVLCAAPSKIRQVMLAAQELDMTNGEYVFFNIQLLSRLVGSVQ